jgi:hypothetical protein
MKPNDKKDDPVVSNPTLEAQAKAIVENPIPAPTQTTQAIVPIGDARVEQIKKSNGQGDRLAVRAANGKFTKMTTAVAHADAKAAQQFLAEKVKDQLGNETSRKHQLRVALFDGAIKAAEEPKALGNAVKAFDSLNADAALTQAKETLLADQNHIQDPVRIVVVPVIDLMHKDLIDFDKKPAEKRVPSFADSVVIQQDGPSGMPKG